MQDFRGLQVWEKSHRATLDVYRATRTFPNEEKYGLTSQLRRSASSVAANIAEGCGRRTDADFGRFLHMALGSACELEYHLLLARDLGLLGITKHDHLTSSITEVKRMLASLIQKLKADS